VVFGLKFKKYFTVLLAVLLVVIAIFPVNAFASTAETWYYENDHTISQEVIDEAQWIVANKKMRHHSGSNYWDVGENSRNFVITSDSNGDIYLISLKYDAGTRFTEVTYDDSYHAMLTSGDLQNYGVFKWDWENKVFNELKINNSSYGQMYTFVGSEYIKAHIDDFKTENNINRGLIFAGSKLIYGYSNSGVLDTALVDFEVFFSSTPVVLQSVFLPMNLQGVLQELIALLPVLVPVIVIYIALRKGYQFIRQRLQAA
jgi:hypothetical protein